MRLSISTNETCGARKSISGAPRSMRKVHSAASIITATPPTLGRYSRVPFDEEPEELALDGLWKAFNNGAEKFSWNPLHKVLRSDEPVSRKLAFVPSMAFFVMGFKDLMQLVSYENPSSKEQESVNLQSMEDGDLWEYYLGDLQLLAEEFCVCPAHSAIEQLWSNETMPVRETVYAFSRHMQTIEDPVARMLLMEVLQVTFNKFKEAVHPVLRETGMYDKLNFFGDEYPEHDHSTSSSKEEISGLIFSLSYKDIQALTPVVEELFERMYDMSAAWSREICPPKAT